MHFNTAPKFILMMITILLLVACQSTSEVVSATDHIQKGQAIAQPYKSAMVTPVDYEYTDQETFSIISWNVEHFVDSHDDPYINNRREDSGNDSMGNRLSYLVDSLKQADADIVVLQEFESAKFLRDIAEKHLPDMGYMYFADAPSHTWYMNVVVMSRFPMGVMYSYGNVTTPVLNWKDEQVNAESLNRFNTRSWSIGVYP